MTKISESNPVSKKIGGTRRASKAREEMKLIFSDDDNPMYFAKDIELAKKFDVSRHTIYGIREELKIAPRSERLLNKLRGIITKKYTIKELSKILNIKYQNLYKVISENKLPIKPDTSPIDHLKSYQTLNKGKKKKRAKNIPRPEKV